MYTKEEALQIANDNQEEIYLFSDGDIAVANSHRSEQKLLDGFQIIFVAHPDIHVNNSIGEPGLFEHGILINELY